MTHLLDQDDVCVRLIDEPGRRALGRAIALVLVALAILAAACGGSPNASVANVGSTTSTTSASSGCSPSGCSSSAASESLEAKALSYAACMRSHGLTDFPDPTIGSNGLPNFSMNASACSHLNPQSPQYQAAQQSCKKELPNIGPQTPAQKATANAEALKYAECMRSNGEPGFPDPNGQGLIHVNASGILAQNSPQYLKAAKACQNLDNVFGEKVQGSAEAGPGVSRN